MPAPLLISSMTDTDAAPITATHDIALSSVPRKNNTVLVIAAQDYRADDTHLISSVADDVSGTWERVGIYNAGAPTAPVTVEAWICYRAPRNMTTVTLTYDDYASTSGHDIMIQALEFSRIGDSSAQVIRVKDTDGVGTSRTFNSDYSTGATITSTTSAYAAVFALGYSPQVSVATSDSEWTALAEVTESGGFPRRLKVWYRLPTSITSPETITITNDQASDDLMGLLIVLGGPDGDGVATALGRDRTRLEYFIAIEGIGWVVNENDISNGFDGTVWSTNDFDSDASAKLGCTVKTGLRNIGSISETLDPISSDYQAGGLTFDIIDTDDWLSTNLIPRQTGTFTALTSEIQYEDTTINLDDGSSFDEGDVVWLGGREAILLGAKALVAGTEYTYTGCTRGYLGTPRGRTHHISPTTSGFAWEAGVTVYGWQRFLHGINVELFARVPGETVDYALRLWSGKLTSVKTQAAGAVYSFSAVGDQVKDLTRLWTAYDMQVISNCVPVPHTRRDHENITNDGLSLESGWDRQVIFGHVGRSSELRPDWKYQIAMMYRYRTEAGGTAGMRSTWDSKGVQSLTTSVSDDHVVMRYVQIGKRIFLCKQSWLGHSDTWSVTQKRAFRIESFSSIGHNDVAETDSIGAPLVEQFEFGTPARVLLDNFPEDYELNHYAYNKTVWRHPINVLLSHMTTRDDEYWRSNTTAGSIETLVQFPAGTVGDPHMWIGAALFCVEGDNKGESRLITANTGSTVTVSPGFTNAPASGVEYQIRNSIYDTLPVGWGMGIPWNRIDISAFEVLRDKYLADAEVGKFIIGTQDKIDIWDMLKKHVLQPFGIAVVLDKSTGKLTPQYIGFAFGDGVLSDYTAIPEREIYSISDIDYNVGKPTAQVVLQVREHENKVVGYKDYDEWTLLGKKHATGTAIRESVPSAVGGDTVDVRVAQSELTEFSDRGTDTHEIEALFNTSSDDVAWLVKRAQAITRFFSVPPPSCELELDVKHMATMQVGDYLSLTKASGVINPFTGTRGWSGLTALVVSTRFVIGSRPVFRVGVILLQDDDGAKIAPASQLDGALSGSDGTSDYFVVAPTSYTSDAEDDKDYYGFQVGDLIDLYLEDGSVYAGANAGPYTISGFGANNSTDPEDADTDIIRIEETVAAAGGIDANHYLTFAAWSANNTTRMETYAAYATAAGALTGGDTAKDYGA